MSSVPGSMGVFRHFLGQPQGLGRGRGRGSVSSSIRELCTVIFSSVCVCVCLVWGRAGVGTPALVVCLHSPPHRGFLQRAIILRSHAHPCAHPRMSEVVTRLEAGGLLGPEWSGPSSPYFVRA
jgi:hypothetical protein